MNVVDHFGAAAIHVENGFAHQVLVQQNPAGLVHKGRKGPRGLPRGGGGWIGWVYKNKIFFNAGDLAPGDELGGFAPAVVNENSHRLGVRFGDFEGQITDFADAVLNIADTDRSAAELGEKKDLVVPASRRGTRRRRTGRRR